MSKYFVRYSYPMITETGYGIDYSRRETLEVGSCIFEMDEEKVSIFNVQDYIFSNTLVYLNIDDRPDFSDIDIISMNKL